MNSTSFDSRMKRYEYVTRNYLTCRTPVVIRVDGKGFHSFTKGFKKPFDELLVDVMQRTMLELCESVEGCVLGYTQSDEISLVLCDYHDISTEPWFGNNILKLCSITASIATSAFNKHFRNAASESDSVYTRKIDRANFDSRAFNIPKEEVCNYMIWRQHDAIRNSVQATAQAYFSHKQLIGVSCPEAIVRLKEEKSVDWNSFPMHLQRGACCIKKPVLLNAGKPNEVLRNKWQLDLDIPMFTDSREYVEKLINF